MSKQKTKTEMYRAQMRSFYMTTNNLNTLKTLNDLILSAPNRTKLVNFAIEKTLGKWLGRINKAKTPKERENLIVKFTMEVKEYANKEDSIN